MSAAQTELATRLPENFSGGVKLFKDGACRTRCGRYGIPERVLKLSGIDGVVGARHAMGAKLNAVVGLAPAVKFHS
jgi:hypothetical protein